MVNKFISLLALLVIFPSVALAQQIYRWKDNKGQWHFSDTPPAEVKAERIRGLDISPKPAQPTSEPPMPMSSSRFEKPSAAPSPLQTEKAQPAYLSQSIVVPFSREGGHVIVEGIVNGRDRVKFIVDTGAEDTSIPLDLVKQSHINLNKSVLMPAVGIGGVVWEPVVEIDSLKVGEAEVKNLGVSKARQGVLVGIRRGLLGANFLDDFRIDIHYDKHQIILERLHGPYGGYPPEWWQKRFRYYHRLKDLYKTLHKEVNIRMTASFLQRCQSARQAAAPMPYDCRIVAGLRTIENKLNNLNSRAYHAGVPHEFRK